MTDEKLIEEAATAMREADVAQYPDWDGMAHIAFDVFEKAHTPTDDERWLNNLSYAATALEASADNGDRYCAHLIREYLAYADRRRSVAPEPSAARLSAPAHYSTPEAHELAQRYLSREQGEPSDAQVLAAAQAYAGDEMTPEEWVWAQTQPEVIQPYLDGMRAALRAVSAVTEQGV